MNTEQDMAEQNTLEQSDWYAVGQTAIQLPYSGIFSRVQNFAESKQRLPE